MRSHKPKGGSGVGRAVQKLREEFDSAFQQPREEANTEQDALLLVRVREELMALRLSELRGVHECPLVTQVPGRYPAQLGLVGIRSTLVTAYSLSAFVTRDESSHPGNWIALSARDHSVGFVFDEVDAYVNIPSDSITRPKRKKRQYTSGTLRTGKEVRSIIDLAAVVDAIRLRLAEAKSKLE